MKAFGAAMFAAGLLLGGAHAAQAAQLHLTYEGSIIELEDYTGLFGAAGRHTSGTYVSTYVFDLDAGALRIKMPGYDQLLGGEPWGAPTPLLSSTFTFNGHTLAVGGNYCGQQINSKGDYTSSFACSQVGDVRTNHANTLYFDAPYDLESSFAVTGTGSAHIDICAVNCTFATLVLQGRFTPTSVTATYVPDTAPVPEPQTWALAILGFGLAGATLRRRRLQGA